MCTDVTDTSRMVVAVLLLFLSKLLFDSKLQAHDVLSIVVLESTGFFYYIMFNNTVTCQIIFRYFHGPYHGVCRPQAIMFLPSEQLKISDE